METGFRNIERFKRYLAERQLHLEEFSREDGVVFRAEQKLDCGTVVTGIIGFYYNSDYVDIYVFDYVSLNNPLKKDLIYSLLNDLNAGYRFSKFYEEDNRISLKTSLMFNGNFDPESVITSLLMLFRSADESYAKFMKIIWA